MLQHLYQKVLALGHLQQPEEPTQTDRQASPQSGQATTTQPTTFTECIKAKHHYQRDVLRTEVTRQLRLEDYRAHSIPPERVIGYVDLLNLVYGAKRAGLSNIHWLNPKSLARNLLASGQLLMHTHCFLAPRYNSKGQDKAKWQSHWIEVVSQIDSLSLHKSYFVQKSHSCNQCGSKWLSSQDKMTDVSIATQIIADAFDNRYDTALLVSSDGCFDSVLRFLQQRFPKKRFLVAFPPWHSPYPLVHACREHLRIRDEQVLDSILPSAITLSNGKVVQRPPTWV